MASDSQRISHITLGKIVVVSICVCVFLFALQAKLSQYDSPSVGVTPVKAAKLWDGEHRLQLPPPVGLAGLPLLLLPLLFVIALPEYFRQRYAVAQHSFVLVQSLFAQASLFFRPPPAL